MSTRLSFAFLTFLLLYAESAIGQGFRTFSGRNHPELIWQIAETAHFKITYPRHLEGLAAEAAPIAEASYRVLSENLGVTFDEKIRIYLSDEDEITNGIAFRIGNGYTNIWVHQNDPETWTGAVKWLRHVMGHELAHIFHFRAVRSNAGWLQFLMSDPLPSFWAEGLAQYQSESWNAQRGDRSLRTAVLDDRLSYSDGRSIRNGQLLYSLGHSQVRYFASQYGDSALNRMLAHRERRLFGLFRVHDFDGALEATIDQNYRSFYDGWRRHVNVYYNMIAGQMEPLDSLAVEPQDAPGQYVYDVQYSPDTSRVAMVVITSNRRRVRRLVVMDRSTGRKRVVAEGMVGAPVSWSPDGRTIAFSRRTRGRHGSLISDLFLVAAEGGGERRLTRSRRATSPSFSPDGQRLAFAGSEGGTANVFVLDLEDGTETRLTEFSGDVQLSQVRWEPSGSRIAFARFASDGTRDVVVADARSGELTVITSGDEDDRGPVWNREGSALAYTSLRDDVPNTFVFGFKSERHERVTYLTVGAMLADWLPPDPKFAEGRFALISNATRDRDRVYVIAADRRAHADSVVVPEEYVEWTIHRPPSSIPIDVRPDPSLVQSRYSYNAWRNITHVASLALPYYGSDSDWGVLGLTAWMEPLAKHLVWAMGGLSISAPVDRSFFVGSYINNQLYPSITLSAYRFPGSARVYGNGLLVEEYTGGDVSVQWPLNWWTRPYARTDLNLRVRAAAYEPLNLAAIDDDLDVLPPPGKGEQTELTIGLTRKKLRPYVDNVVHPLDGKGLRLRATAAMRILGTDREFVRGDVAAYHVLGERILPGLHRLFAYGRVQAQSGSSFPQDYLGFSKYDDVRLSVPGVDLFLTGDAERVRGYRSYALGNRVLFGSMEYRAPLLPTLQTQILGVLSLGATTLSAFADAGVVWSSASVGNADSRIGAGFELKNALRLGNLFEFAHAIGVGWAMKGEKNREIYYRIRTALPF